MKNLYGYIFTGDRKEEKQLITVLTDLGVPAQSIFSDCSQENGSCRPKLIRMERKLRPDDLVYIKSLTCLGSSYGEILEQWRTLTKKRKADVAVLDMPLLDTRRGKEFMGTMVSDVVMETLAFVTENEHEKHSRRSTRTYLEAKSRGVRYGRPISPLPENFVCVYERWKAGEITGADAARECDMPLSTFRWRANRYSQEQENLDAAVSR